MKPTRKISYVAVSTVLLFIISRFTEVDKDVEQAVNVAVPLILGYFVQNDNTPGGYPVESKVV